LERMQIHKGCCYCWLRYLYK